MATPEEKRKIKNEFLEYYRKVPIKKYAAAHVGKSEDTMKRWEDEDADFADQIRRAKAEFLERRIVRIRDDKWIIERLFREFTPQQKQEVEHTGEVHLTYHQALRLIKDEQAAVSEPEKGGE